MKPVQAVTKSFDDDAADDASVTHIYYPTVLVMVMVLVLLLLPFCCCSFCFILPVFTSPGDPVSLQLDKMRVAMMKLIVRYKRFVVSIRMIFTWIIILYFCIDHCRCRQKQSRHHLCYLLALKSHKKIWKMQ